MLLLLRKVCLKWLLGTRAINKYAAPGGCCGGVGGGCGGVNADCGGGCGG